MLEEYSIAPNDDEALLRWFVHGESFPDPLLMVDVSPLGGHADTTPEYLWYLKDALGSTGALANLAGEIVEGYVYTPYGETTILDEFNRPREVVAREAFFHDANFDGVIDGFDWVDLQTHLAAAEAGVFNPVALRVHDHNGDGRLDAADEANFLTAWQPEDPAAAVPPQWRRPRGPVVDVLADGSYDVIDFLMFQTCLGHDSAGCVTLFDINKDAVVDITDYELYAHTWAGPDEPHNFARGSKYGNPFLWTGQRYEAETGLYHFVYRSYSPTTGKFLQRDKLGVQNPNQLIPDAGDEYVYGLSLYSYADENPLIYTDPLGLFFGYVGALSAGGLRLDLNGLTLSSGLESAAGLKGIIALAQMRNAMLGSMIDAVYTGTVMDTLDALVAGSYLISVFQIGRLGGGLITSAIKFATRKGADFASWLARKTDDAVSLMQRRLSRESGSLCFVAGTEILGLDGPVSIDAIEVGMLVLSAPDDSSIDRRSATAESIAKEMLPRPLSPMPDDYSGVDEGEWRLLRLVMHRPNGSKCDITLLRPNAWLDAVDAVVGGWVSIEMPELGLRGMAHVLAIEPCPALFDPPRHGYQQVIGKFITTNVPVIELTLDGLDQPIGTTATHHFLSLDRDAWLAATDLVVGERLRAYPNNPVLSATIMASAM